MDEQRGNNTPKEIQQQPNQSVERKKIKRTKKSKENKFPGY
jgi:hypothetical protein